MPPRPLTPRTNRPATQFQRAGGRRRTSVCLSSSAFPLPLPRFLAPQFPHTFLFASSPLSLTPQLPALVPCFLVLHSHPLQPFPMLHSSPCVLPPRSSLLTVSHLSLTALGPLPDPVLSFLPSPLFLSLPVPALAPLPPLAVYLPRPSSLASP